MAATVLLCLAGGYWLDGKLGTRPVFFLAGAAFGLFAAFYSFSKQVKGRRP
jgi:F0F1-type ATP synthase assembly protein I